VSHGASPLAAFHRVGDRSRLPESNASTAALRPALFGNYRDLDALRTDFPLLLTSTPGTGPWVISLADAVDALLRQTTHPGAANEETRRKALALEESVRRNLQQGRATSLPEAWEAAWHELAGGDNATPQGAPQSTSLSASLSAPAAPEFEGDLIRCDRQTAGRLVRRAWLETEGRKGRQLHARIQRLEQKLMDILQADFMHSGAARSAERLENAVGGTDHAVFDFAAMARVLRSAPAADPLPVSRRRRIEEAIDTLRSQRFVGPDGLPGASGLHPFEFDDCTAAREAFRDRLDDMQRLVRAIAIADLEADNHYDEARHDLFFEALDADRLGPGDFELFPSYLVCIEELDGSHRNLVLDLLESGFPFKIIAQSTDIIGYLASREDQVSSGKPGQHLARMALGLDDVFVLQAPNAFLYRMRREVLQAVGVPQAALISVYAGTDYLASASACESRAFPCFAYDPSATGGQAGRFRLLGNPQQEQDWPRHHLDYETDAHDRQGAETAFTVVDFVAQDPRFAPRFAAIADDAGADGDNDLVAIDAYLQLSDRQRARAVPCVMLIDEHDRLRRFVVDDKLVEAAARCLNAWRNLQELGGIGNSHARSALGEAQRRWDEEKAQLSARPSTQPTAAAATAAPVPTAAAPAAPSTAAAAAPEQPAAPPSSDDPWIETIRCTSCNECKEINDRMFAYDEDNRAHIADPDAGTYRELVQAAETCQVAIIHPGKPRNPAEPGLDELIKRAEPFL
jgi:hypothetical protein